MAAFEEAVAKQPPKKATAKEMREAENMPDEEGRGSKLATATAKKETDATAKKLQGFYAELLPKRRGLRGLLCSVFCRSRISR